MILLLDYLIRKKPIGVILDHIEITVPGNILALLAIKYNLPFINAPQVLISDRSIIPTRATQYFLWCNNYKKWFEERGVESQRIIITGNLRYQYETNEKSMAKADFIKQLNIPKSNLIVTFTSQTFPKEVNVEAMKWIKNAVQNLPLTIIIKPHPFDSLDYSQYKSEPKITLVSKNFPLKNILENSDFLMTISSNTAIEAAMLGKGILVLQPEIPYHYEQNNNDINSFLIKSKAGIPIYSSKELSNILKELVEDEKFRASTVATGQQFLKETLDLSGSPADLMKSKILELI